LGKCGSTKTFRRVELVTVLGACFAGFGCRNLYLSYFHTVLWYSIYSKRHFLPRP